MKTFFQKHLRILASLGRELRALAYFASSYRTPAQLMRYNNEEPGSIRKRSRKKSNPNKVFIFYAVSLLIFCLPAVVFSQKTLAVTGVSITVEDFDREVDFFCKKHNKKLLRIKLQLMKN